MEPGSYTLSLGQEGRAPDLKSLGLLLFPDNEQEIEGEHLPLGGSLSFPYRGSIFFLSPLSRFFHSCLAPQKRYLQDYIPWKAFLSHPPARLPSLSPLVNSLYVSSQRHRVRGLGKKQLL